MFGTPGQPGRKAFSGRGKTGSDPPSPLVAMRQGLTRVRHSRRVTSGRGSQPMKITTRFMVDGDRYGFDVERCHWMDGWAPFDTGLRRWLETIRAGGSPPCVDRGSLPRGSKNWMRRKTIACRRAGSAAYRTRSGLHLQDRRDNDDRNRTVKRPILWSHGCIVPPLGTAQGGLCAFAWPAN